MRAGLTEQVHPFPPIYDCRSTVLIVGSFPSVKSRETGFYYGNPRNRFWQVMAALFDTQVPQTIDEKRCFVLDRGIALFDVLQSCEIAASSDASIRRDAPNDFSVIFEAAPIRRVFANGRAACGFYQKHISNDVEYLPSTSPANAAWTLERLTDAWKAILPYLHESVTTSCGRSPKLLEKEERT